MPSLRHFCMAYASSDGGHPANRVYTAKWIGYALCCAGVVRPPAIHHETIFVSALRQGQVLRPATFAQRDHGCCVGVPAVECAGDGNRLRSGRIEFKMNSRLSLSTAITPVRLDGSSFILHMFVGATRIFEPREANRLYGWQDGALSVPRLSGPSAGGMGNGFCN